MVRLYFNLLRVPQWIKNFFIFVPLIFSIHLFEINFFKSSLLGFIIFCLISSSVYIINDLIDIEEDKVHPTKKFRPIPSGLVSKNRAIAVAVFLVFISIPLLMGTNLYFSLTVILYFLITIFYSIKIKHIVILDVFTIAAGFMLRIIAGAFVINVEISSWLILTTMFISLFLAVMKRRSELKLVTHNENAATRKVLVHYSNEFVDQMSTVTSAGVIICYALYTVSQRTVSIFHTENLIYTTPYVVFGIFRYMYLVYVGNKGENAAEIVLSDVPMILNLAFYVVTVIIILYK